MTRIALVTAVLCVLAPFSIPLPFSPVPLSLTNFVLFLSIFVLNWKSAMLSYVLYLLLGTVGLPVFSGFSGGVGKLAGPTGGYLVGFILLVGISGISMYIGREKMYYLYYIVGVVLGEAAMYLLGTAWLAYSLGVSYKEALFIGVVPYLVWDGVKMLLAMKVGQSLRAALTRSMGRDPIL